MSIPLEVIRQLQATRQPPENEVTQRNEIQRALVRTYSNRDFARGAVAIVTSDAFSTAIAGAFFWKAHFNVLEEAGATGISNVFSGIAFGLTEPALKDAFRAFAAKLVGVLRREEKEEKMLNKLADAVLNVASGTATFGSVVAAAEQLTDGKPELWQLFLAFFIGLFVHNLSRILIDTMLVRHNYLLEKSTVPWTGFYEDTMRTIFKNLFDIKKFIVERLSQSVAFALFPVINSVWMGYWMGEESWKNSIFKRALISNLLFAVDANTFDVFGQLVASMLPVAEEPAAEIELADVE